MNSAEGPARIAADIEAVSRISTMPTILRVITEITGFRLALVARVTPNTWTACAVLDLMGFGLKVGGKLDVATTLCSQVRDTHEAVVIEHASADPTYCNHPTPKMYGFESYVATPIFLPNGEYFGNVCALDSNPIALTPHMVGMMKLFAELISLQLSFEEDAERQRKELIAERETARLREQFIAVLGHDLRNPLSAVISGSAFLLDLPQDDTNRTILQRVRSSGQRMARLVDDLLDFARGHLGISASLFPEETDVDAVVADVIDEILASHQNRRITLSGTGAGRARLNRSRLAQMVSNLVANAVDHGASGQPIEVITARGDDRLSISVVSRGAPIPATVATRMFDAYSRGGTGGPRTGLGLGLHIAREIARAHSGDISVHSGEDGVTTFTIELPVEPGER